MYIFKCIMLCNHCIQSNVRDSSVVTLCELQLCVCSVCLELCMVSSNSIIGGLASTDIRNRQMSHNINFK